MLVGSIIGILEGTVWTCYIPYKKLAMVKLLCISIPTLFNYDVSFQSNASLNNYGTWILGSKQIFKIEKSGISQTVNGLDNINDTEKTTLRLILNCALFHSQTFYAEGCRDCVCVDRLRWINEWT